MGRLGDSLLLFSDDRWLGAFASGGCRLFGVGEVTLKFLSVRNRRGSVVQASTGSKTKAKTSRSREPLLIDLALQGGGSHGAFSWGVLDRLMEEDWLIIEGISGTSAGAMNAAVLASGFAKGGAEGARLSLEAFWRKVSEGARFSPFQRSPLDVLMGRWSLDRSPMFLATDMMSRVFSPYDLNPMGTNPLAGILSAIIDFEALSKGPIKLFVTATNVHTGRGRVFRNPELTVDVLLASACLPSMFQAVEIDGEKYWDGGYSGNPTMAPLIRECASQDTLLVQINPISRDETPRSASDIISRLNEISFNAVLIKELRAMALLRKLDYVEDSEGARMAAMRVHRIASPVMNDLGYSSKLNAEWAFLTMLRDEGRRTADLFLQQHGDDLGHRETTIDFEELLTGI
ncbi:MAG: patatin-like phospholipase family protein [Methylobacterium sp.]|nr:patatin-like phospholipase family protein [Methylobacterium sp.]MCA3672020.1 patatin-like phospholipase family protein [Methylobacterium sp.]MCA3676835.1 patatin-like phospholipase family protein [Methylobacterium sp.]MCA3681271.1 patatin-like phospholipase family protein [Methylobacterium sp.]MCA3682625.1 patatin-like phospholipase family protein [Methylobacterium sp.]